MVYYNEIDPFAAAWLRELITDGQIPAGEIDTRSIVDIRPSDVRRFRHCHWFAGIGGWPYAVTLAGWPADRAIWTGSCPCQPISEPGQHVGAADARDLWPAWAYLIDRCRPPVVVGEQVSAAVPVGWVDRVFDDLERIDYAVAAVDLPAGSVGAFHIRQRVWFVADRGLADGDGVRRDRVAAAGVPGNRQRRDDVVRRRRPGDAAAWADAVWIPCQDGRRRPIKPGLLPLADGIPNRVDLLRGTGNAIVPQVGAAFLEAYCDVKGIARNTGI